MIEAACQLRASEMVCASPIRVLLYRVGRGEANERADSDALVMVLEYLFR